LKKERLHIVSGIGPQFFVFADADTNMQHVVLR